MQSSVKERRFDTFICLGSELCSSCELNSSFMATCWVLVGFTELFHHTWTKFLRRKLHKVADVHQMSTGTQSWRSLLLWAAPNTAELHKVLTYSFLQIKTFIQNNAGEFFFPQDQDSDKRGFMQSLSSVGLKFLTTINSHLKKWCVVLNK